MILEKERINEEVLTGVREYTLKTEKQSLWEDVTNQPSLLNTSKNKGL